VPLIYVTSSNAGSGKTGIAVAIARHYAYRGVPTLLARVEGDGDAARDAAFFASLDFVPGSAPATFAPGVLADPGSRDLLVAEGSPADAPAGARIVLIGKSALPEVPSGMAPAVVVVTDVSADAAAQLPESVAGAPVIALTSDRVLAGFEASTVREILNAETLVDGDPSATTCDNLVIAPIGSDAGQPYFRRFQRACVVVRFDKTDQHLAALRSDPVCLVLTGGRRPSEYTFDAARAKGVPVYLSRTDTENTVILLESLFDRTRFVGDAKVERMSGIVEDSGIFDALAIEVPIASA